MAYKTLKGIEAKHRTSWGLEEGVISFLRERCENLRFEKENTEEQLGKAYFTGTSLKKGDIPYNMQKDIDRLCLENAAARFLKSGKKDDAFDVYFCYLEMFVGDYEKTRRMIELLSEFEANGSGLLMKHRDHYSHSVYVFLLGLAIYETNQYYRKAYSDFYHLTDEQEAAHHYLQYWGLASLFHDIGYPFELPFEQVASYFEVEGQKRSKRPYISYNAMDTFVTLQEEVKEKVRKIYPDREFTTSDELFAYAIYEDIGNAYPVTEDGLAEILSKRAMRPDRFGFFIDHGYFSATVLFQKLFAELQCELKSEHIDALVAILLHNSLYKFEVAHYKEEGNIPFHPELHPLAYMLMLCDELQCWDLTAYGRNSKVELHPMECVFDFSDNQIRATYLYNEKEIIKINQFKDEFINWLADRRGKAPELKAYSGMYIKNEAGVSSFLADIRRIVDLTEIGLQVEMGVTAKSKNGARNYLSNSNFINLYNFAMVMNGRWNNAAWKQAKMLGQEEKFLSNKTIIREFADKFKMLSLEYKLSNINQAKAFAHHMEKIGCFYTDKPVDFELVESFRPEELARIGQLEHQRWLQEHYDMGWTYGEPEREKREYVREHKDLIPGYKLNAREVSEEEALDNYNRLDKEEQDKDTDPMECMMALMKMMDGIRIYRLYEK